MVKIQGKQCEFFNFEIIDYQFSKEGKNKYDKNWLILKIEVKNEYFHWKTKDPAILTWEMQELISWLNSIVRNPNTAKPEIWFIEPNISFEFLGKNQDNFKFKSIFQLELKPKECDDEECIFNFELSKDKLDNLIKELIEETNKFPERV